MKRYFNYALAEKLCDKASGAGLDTAPRITESSQRIQVVWEYHLMDDNGFYDGYWGFRLTIPGDDPMSFRITGRAGNHERKSAYGIKEDLGDMFAVLMPVVLEENGIRLEPVREKIYPGDSGYNPALLFATEHGYHYGRELYWEYSGELREGR
jgi:hypothetical protein